jgi:hypothetical protein
MTMLKKLGAVFMAIAVSVTFLPEASAQQLTPKQKNKVNRLFKQLNGIANRSMLSGKVRTLVHQLSLINPEKSPKWYTVGTKKYAIYVTNKGQFLARWLAKQVIKNIKSSNLTEQKKQSLIAKIKRISDGGAVVPPYQAEWRIQRERVLA